MDLTFKRCSGLKWNFACFDNKGNFSKCQSFIIFLSLLISSNARNPQTVMWVVIFFSFSSRLYVFFIRRTWFFFFSLPLISNINLSDHNAQTLQPTLSQRVLPFTLPFSCMSIRCKNLLLGFKIMCKSSSWAFCSSPGNISNPDDLSAQPRRIPKGILHVWCFRRIWVRRRWFNQCQCTV